MNSSISTNLARTNPAKNHPYASSTLADKIAELDHPPQFTMQSRRIARELALLGMSQLTDETKQSTKK
ncbi:MAG: hypothetical protein AAFY17_09415, partial [Cyanobacteria bacterium J06642_11]